MTVDLPCVSSSSLRYFSLKDRANLSLSLSLADAEFVASVLVRESTRSSVGDDDKIYYFFTERAGEESTSIFEKTQVPRVARVARVCKVK